MKNKIFLLLLIFLVVLSFGCSTQTKENNDESLNEYGNNIYDDLSDNNFLSDYEDDIYEELLEILDERYYVQNVDTKYISKEYVEELEYNSQANIYFGYTLQELEGLFENEKYVFTLDENGETTVCEYNKYDDTYDKIIKNVIVGSGVILVCVTVSVITSPAAPAISLIFAGSAKRAATMALSSGGIAALTAGAITGIQTKDWNESLKQAAIEGSESFKWGAIAGAIEGAIKTGVSLNGATENGLTMNQAARIQKESKLPLAFIKNFHSVNEYEVYKKSNLKIMKINGNWAYVQNVDWNIKDSLGRTNAERVKKGFSPIDKNGVPLELHHIGQNPDAPLAILTNADHHKNDKDLHYLKGQCESLINRPEFNKQKKEFWLSYLELTFKG